MKKMYLLTYNQKSIGVRVIVDAFFKYFNEKIDVAIAHSLDEVEPAGFVIPYGPKETFEALKKGFEVPLSLMVDYHTLSLRNRSLFLLKNGCFFSKNLLKSVLAFFYYYLVEHYIYTHCSNFMFVSQNDIDVIKRRFPNNHYYCVPNGVNIPVGFEKKSRRAKVTFGILSGWTAGTFLEAKWFIDKFWPVMLRHNPQIQLIICGKYASKSMIEYFNKQPNVSFIGEVQDLAEFFDSIDIYVATKPIGCGILNKVLDAMAYKTLVVGISQSFTGFSYMDNSFVVCDKVEDYLRVIDNYTNNREFYKHYVENAYNNIQLFNDWGKNYNKFIKELVENNVITIE